MYGYPSNICAGPDGDLWFTDWYSSKIFRITVEGSFTEYPVPTPNSSPYGITAGPDGNLWFTEYGGDKIGRITTEGALAEYGIPTRRSAPWGITSGPDGNVWFAENLGNKIGALRPPMALPRGLRLRTASGSPTVVIRRGQTLMAR